MQILWFFFKELKESPKIIPKKAEGLARRACFFASFLTKKKYYLSIPGHSLTQR